MSGVLLLQFHDDVSDEEAVQRLMFDLRWQVALNLPTDFPGFDPSSLTYFRQRLIEHNQERYAFDRFVKVGREAGFIPDRVTLLTDTTRTKGAGAVMDTYTLLRKGIRKLLKQLGYAAAGKQRGLSPETQRLIATYVEQDRKAKLDWTDPQQRAAQLQVLFQDAEAALELATEQMDDADVRSTGWLLVKIMGDDIAARRPGPPADCRRHGAGSHHQHHRARDAPWPQEQRPTLRRFQGCRDHRAVQRIDPGHPGHAGRRQRWAGTDAHHRAGRAACRRDRRAGHWRWRLWLRREPGGLCDAPGPTVDLVAPLARPDDPEVDKSAFAIDLAAQTATCPQGHTVTGQAGSPKLGLPTLRFTFPRATCEACPLFKRCVKSKTAGRTVQTHPYEAHLQAARQRQQTDEFKDAYRLRPPIERKQAELVDHGLRRHALPGPPEAPTPAPLASGHRQPEAPVPALRIAQSGLERTSGTSRTDAIEPRNGVR